MLVFQECNLNQVIITIVFGVLIFIIEVFKHVVFLPLNHFKWKWIPRKLPKNILNSGHVDGWTTRF